MSSSPRLLLLFYSVHIVNAQKQHFNPMIKFKNFMLCTHYIDSISIPNVLIIVDAKLLPALYSKCKFVLTFRQTPNPT